MEIRTATSSNIRVVLSDILVLCLVYFIPAISHLIPFPLYVFDPMRILLLTGYLLSRNNTNAYLLALTIPLFSMLTGGHPPFLKAFLISIELFTNFWLFILLLERLKWSVPIALFLSIIMSKIIYYALKYILLYFAFLDGNLVTTDLLTQFLTVVFIVLVFSILYKKKI